MIPKKASSNSDILTPIIDRSTLDAKVNREEFKIPFPLGFWFLLRFVF